MSARTQRRALTKKRALRVRNAHRPRGAELTLHEVLVFARDGHQRCRAITGKPAGVLRNPRTGAYEFCPCVVEGLIARHPEVILTADGKAYWPADEDDEAPYQEVAEAGTAIESRETRPPAPGETDETPRQLLAGEHTVRVDGCLCVVCRPGDPE